MDDRLQQHRADVEDRAISAAQRALAAKRGHENLRRRAALGARAAAALPSGADAATAAAVSGLAHSGEARRAAWLLVLGTAGGAALVENTARNHEIAQRAREAGVVASWCTAAEWFGGLP